MIIKVNAHKITKDNAEQMQQLLLAEWEKQTAEAAKPCHEKPQKRRKRDKSI